MESDVLIEVNETSSARNMAAQRTDSALTGVRRWLEDAWRHGEIVVDDDWLETLEPTRQPNRFDVSRHAGEAAEQEIV